MMVRMILLICGVLSSVLYAGADIYGAMRYPGYNYVSQTVSELSAIGAPSRPLVAPFFGAYGVLLIAFGLGVWESAGANRTRRIVAGLLVGFGAVCLTGPLTPMHQRGAGFMLTDTLHIISAMLDVSFILLIIGFGARAFGSRFRIYSIATFLIVFGFGAWAGSYGPQISANLPTPWAGVAERICIGAYLLWFAVLAIALLRVGVTDGGARRDAGPPPLRQRYPNTYDKDAAVDRARALQPELGRGAHQ